MNRNHWHSNSEIIGTERTILTTFSVVALLANIELAAEMNKDNAEMSVKIKKLIADITVIISSAMATAKAAATRNENGKEKATPESVGENN